MMSQHIGMLAELEAAVSSLQAAGTVTGSVGERLDRLVADVAEAVEGRGDPLAGYVIGSLAGQACGMAEVAERDGDGDGAGRWREVAIGARRIAVALLGPTVA